MLLGGQNVTTGLGPWFLILATNYMCQTVTNLLRTYLFSTPLSSLFGQIILGLIVDFSLLSRCRNMRHIFLKKCETYFTIYIIHIYIQSYYTEVNPPYSTWTYPEVPEPRTVESPIPLYILTAWLRTACPQGPDETWLPWLRSSWRRWRRGSWFNFSGARTFVLEIPNHVP